MDNKKIGKLISDLRKKQGLTQEQLGDKVGVGFRAVSKWERGITLPDITIINELSKILGISSDELLSGELKDKPQINNNKKTKPYITITISIITIIILFITSIFIYQNNKTYKYEIISVENEEFYVKGNVYFDKDVFTMLISEIQFKNIDFSNTIIKNYEYKISVNNNLLFGYGYIGEMNFLEKPISIEEFSRTFKINYNGKISLTREEIINNNITISFKFLEEDNTETIKNINIRLK